MDKVRILIKILAESHAFNPAYGLGRAILSPKLKA